MGLFVPEAYNQSTRQSKLNIPYGHGSLNSPFRFDSSLICLLKLLFLFLSISQLHLYSHSLLVTTFNSFLLNSYQTLFFNSSFITPNLRLAHRSANFQIELSPSLALFMTNLCRENTIVGQLLLSSLVKLETRKQKLETATCMFASRSLPHALA